MATGYLRGGAGCVTTAAWWCQKQPPTPMAAAMVMAKAIKMRIAFPSSLHNTSEKREVLVAVSWTSKQTGTVAAQPQNCFMDRIEASSARPERFSGAARPLSR
jgi:hypothetical protein